MKKHGTLTSGFKTFVAVFSVLIGFSALCVLALFGLYRGGILEISHSAGTAETQGPSEERILLPVHEASDERATPLADPADEAKTLLASLPFCHSFYIRATVEQRTGDDGFSVSSYDIWRYGESFRINRYNEKQEAELLVNCNGKAVLTVDYQTLATETSVLDEAHSFARLSPFFYGQKTENITSFSSLGGILTVVCGDEASGTYQKSTFDLTTGLMLSCEIYENAVLQTRVKCFSADTDFAFADYMFDFSLITG